LTGETETENERRKDRKQKGSQKQKLRPTTSTCGFSSKTPANQVSRFHSLLAFLITFFL
jgi:hypothetical protein